MRAQSDEELMAAVRGGERAALATLVQRHHSALLGYLYRFIGGDRALAEDLTQETFLQVLRHSTRPIDRSFKAWLYTIATNLARDHFKAAAHRHGLWIEDDAILDRCDPAPGPEDMVLAAEQEELLLSALGQLSSEYRAALLLRFFNDLSLQEIATTLQIPVGTVKSRLSVGLRHLRAIISTITMEVK